LLGQISASLAAMHRTIDDYDAMAKREIIKAKQEKAQMCVLAPVGLPLTQLLAGACRNSDQTIQSFVHSLSVSKMKQLLLCVLRSSSRSINI
jgi:hypothetical protein